MRFVLLLMCAVTLSFAFAGEDWPQFKYDSIHSGNIPDRDLATPLGLVGAVPLTDAVFTAPAVADGRVFVVDGAGVAFSVDAASLKILWKVPTQGGKAHCNNVCSPAVAGKYMHFGTMAGRYYVLNASDGSLVKEISCGEPVFSCPVVGQENVYFATVGSRVYALKPDGTIRWVWDFVKERVGFHGDRWSGEAWGMRGQRVTWREQFCCSRNIALHGELLVIPAGGSVVWLEDGGDRPILRHVYAPKESPSTLGLSMDEEGNVYKQWYRRDNGGRVEILKLAEGEVKNDYVRGTQTSYTRPESMAFSSVSVRGSAVYRCRPEENFGFCSHSRGGPARYMGGAPSIASPILLSDKGVFGGLDGRLYVVPLSAKEKVWSFKTAFGKPISAPVAVCGGRVFFGCEDGYLYVLGPEGSSPLPRRDLELWRIRSPLTGKYANQAYDWHTSFGNMANTNVNIQGMKPPFKIKWIRRYEGTVKHFSVCGGGRMYTHTAEGQIFAVEQETGRLLWRTYFPGVHVSYTSPLYYKERLYVPQADPSYAALARQRGSCSGRRPSQARPAGTASSRR
jgi:outer membrane protein assembly factor BamB